MRASFRKPPSFALVALYLLAVTAAGRFHAHRGPVGDDCGGLSRVRCCPGDHASSPPPVPQVVLGEIGNADECPVCQFLAQKFVSPTAEQSAGWRRLPESPAPVEPARPMLGFFLIQRSRAPPSCV
ncbi:MAG: hypothetical protein NUV77_10380 [Thermoguttaceae bacterium]|nr:hypothetical protein [Thermoguttaceae bacterium]